MFLRHFGDEGVFSSNAQRLEVARAAWRRHQRQATASKSPKNAHRLYGRCISYLYLIGVIE